MARAAPIASWVRRRAARCCGASGSSRSRLGENLVGRDPECALTIPSGLVSRQHARILVAGERATLQDLGSKNGTLLGGRRVEGETPLADGDEIRIGPALLVFCAPGAGSTRTRR